MKELKIEYIPVDDLKPNEYNPNKQSDETFNLLVKSIREDGFTQPIVAQNNGVIVDGEHRWRAAQALGMKVVPVVRVDMTEIQRRIATIRHNRARGTEDGQLIQSLMSELRSLDIDWAKEALNLEDSDFNIETPKNGEIWIPDVAEEQYDVERKQVEISRDSKDVKPSGQTSLAPAGQKENRPITLTLTYSEEEWSLIKKAVGNNIAAGILELCKSKLQSA